MFGELDTAVRGLGVVSVDIYKYGIKRCFFTEADGAVSGGIHVGTIAWTVEGHLQWSTMGSSSLLDANKLT